MQEHDHFEPLGHVVEGLNAKFNDGNDPFQIIARPCREAGALAQAVNHAEHRGFTVQKNGVPDLGHVADEVHHVLRAALAAAGHCGIVQEVTSSIDRSSARPCADGSLPPPPV